MNECGMYEVISYELRISKEKHQWSYGIWSIRVLIPSYSDQLRKRVGFLLLTDWISSTPRVVKSAFRHSVMLAIVAYQPATQLKIVTGSEKLWTWATKQIPMHDAFVPPTKTGQFQRKKATHVMHTRSIITLTLTNMWLSNHCSKK